MSRVVKAQAMNNQLCPTEYRQALTLYWLVENGDEHCENVWMYGNKTKLAYFIVDLYLQYIYIYKHFYILIYMWTTIQARVNAIPMVLLC